MATGMTPAGTGSYARARHPDLTPAPAPSTRHGQDITPAPAIRGHFVPAGTPVPARRSQEGGRDRGLAADQGTLRLHACGPALGSRGCRRVSVGGVTASREQGHRVSGAAEQGGRRATGEVQGAAGGGCSAREAGSLGGGAGVLRIGIRHADSGGAEQGRPPAEWGLGRVGVEVELRRGNPKVVYIYILTCRSRMS
jgi:hypothetical protein